MKITQRSAAALEPTDRDIWHWDDTLKGFAVRIRPGVPPAYWVKFKLPDGTQRKKNLGPIATTKAEAARDHARDLLEAARRGRDVLAESRAARLSPTIADLAERHQREHAPPVIAKTSHYNNAMLWRLHILPAIGKKRVDQLTHVDVTRLHKEYDGSRYLGNRVLACLSKAFTDCEHWGWRPSGSNPCRRVKRFPEKRVERLLEPEELERLLAVTARLKTEWNVPGRAWAAPYLVELLIFSGLRLREWCMAEWAWVDEERGIMTLPRTKTDRNRVVMLSPEVREILRSMPRPTKWIIPNSDHKGPMKWFNKTWLSIKKLAKIEGRFRNHDIRHTFASYALTVGGLDIKTVSMLLGHETTSTTERYLSATERQQAEAARAGSGTMLKIRERAKV